MNTKRLILILIYISHLSLFLGCSTLGTQPTATSNVVAPKEKTKPMVDNSKEALLNIPYRGLNTNKDITKIGFGSCVDQNKPQPAWTSVLQNSPDLFIMMGDNVYASRKEDRPFIDQYIKLNKETDYAKLREATPFLAIWDDHDFGQNDGGIDNPDKEEARKWFLKYWAYLKPTLPENQKALYHSRIIGKKHKVQIILMDTRWDRSPLIKNPDYNPEDKDNTSQKLYLSNDDKKAQILSSEQWAWLEKEFKKTAQLRILVSSIQLIPQEHGFEKWGNFPKEKEKLLNLIKKYSAKNTIILSGDRHFASFAKTDIKGLGKVFEITSSGINKPSKAKSPEKDPAYLEDPFLLPNFGLLTIDWNKRQVKAEIKDENNKTQIEHSLQF